MQLHSQHYSWESLFILVLFIENIIYGNINIKNTDTNHNILTIHTSFNFFLFYEVTPYESKIVEAHIRF